MQHLNIKKLLVMITILESKKGEHDDKFFDVEVLNSDGNCFSSW